MAGISSDYILQQILDQNVAANDNLSAMRTLLVDIEKNGKTGGGGGSGGGDDDTRRRNRNDRNNNDSASFSKAFKDIFGEMKNIGGSVLGNNGSIQNTVGAVGASARVLQSSLGKLPGPIGAVASGFMQIVQAGVAVYEYLNEQLNMYNQLNSAGLTLADGMLTVRKGAAGAFLSINEYSKVLEKNSDAIAAMDGQYGDGVEHFGKLLNTVQLTQEKMGLYGVSQQQLADLTAKNYKFEKMYSGQQQLRSMTESQSTEKFVGTMTYLSKTVGKSVDELLSKFNDMGQNLDTGLSQDALTQYYGLSEDKAAQVSKSMNSIFASMGEAGAQLQKLNASKLQTNALPEEFNNQFTQMYTDQIKQLQLAGITDEKQIRRHMSQYVADHKRQLDDEIRYQNLAGNTTAAAWLNQLRNIENTLNDPKNQPSPIIENFTNRFNLWIGKTFTEPFNNMYVDIQEKTASYLTNLADNSANAWDFTAKLVRDGLKAIPNVFSDGMTYLVSLLEGWATDLFGDSYTQVSQSFENFMNDFMNLPNMLWDSITGWWNSSRDDKIDGIKSAASSMWDNIKGVFTDIGNTTPPGQEETKKSFMDMYNSLNDKLNTYLNKFKSWWNGDDENQPTGPTPQPTPNKNPPIANQPKTVGQQKVTAPAEYTKPIKIEQTDQTAPDEMQTAQNSSGSDATTKILAAILNNLESQGQANSQAAIILRQIADNTEPARNV
ncbi:hypothetical protein pEaSNUABM44_00247 [Erwinia phage pEa_SNUABM_44]|nr:hypothetical protein pEaSNUABM44_00247 [Erwinia phage pEa_SNUABM_44]